MRFTVCIALLVLSIGQAFASGGSEDRVSGIFGIHDVTVRGEFLDVSVTGPGSDGVDMSSTPDGRFRIRHELLGGTLNIWVEKPWPFWFGGRGTLRLRVPRSARLRVETVSGRIGVEGLSADSCDLKSISGRIEAHDVEGRLTTQTVSGAIQLSGTRGSISAKTVSGAVKGDDISFLDDSAFSSVSGRIDIHPAMPLDALRFDLSSISGRLVVGTIGAAKGLKMGFLGPLVRAQSVSGSLTFR